jgi:hypothetical protein
MTTQRQVNELLWTQEFHQNFTFTWHMREEILLSLAVSCYLNLKASTKTSLLQKPKK